MVNVLILVCLGSLEPSACTPSSALYRIHAPDASVEQCAMSGQTIVAAQPHAILGREYVKVLCGRRLIG